MLDLGGDVLDKHWWRRTNIVLEYIRRQLRARLYKCKFQFNLALIDYNTPQLTFDLHHKQAEFARNSFIHELLPWLDVGPKTVQDSVEAMRKQYLKRFADPQSDEGKEALRKQLMKWGPSYARRFSTS